MNRYTPRERAEIVQIFYVNNSSIILAQREYRRKYGRRRVPSAKTFRRLAANFEQTGSTSDKPHIGRPRSARSRENIDRVREDVMERPRTSTRKRSTQLTISRRSLQRILVKDLHLFPYKIQATHKILPVDLEKRLQYCNAMVNLENEIDEFWNKIIMSDEAHFCLNGAVNKQNHRFWGSENPQIIHQQPLHEPKVTVWCGVSARKIIGPYFFEDDRGRTTTVNGDRYRSMLLNFLVPEMEELNQEDMWYQQDGATAHTARETMAILNRMFPGRLISKNADMAYPPRSPDLTVPDFWLWGYLKDKVFANHPQTLEALQGNIREEIGRIPPEMLEKVMKNALKRAHSCINARGGHLVDIIFSV